MSLRLVLAIIGATALFFACSSFSDAPGADGGPDASGATDAGPPGDATTVPDSAAPDPCEGAADPASTPYASLYIANGLVATGSTAGGTVSGTESIMRAPLFCDGSTGAFTEIGMLPRANYDGNAVVVENRPLILNGQEDTANTFVGYEFLGAVMGAAGDIQWRATNEILDPPRWRFAAAATTSHAYVIGGEDKDAGPLSDVTMLSVSPDDPAATLIGKHVAALPELVFRVSAAIAQDKLVVYGGSELFWATLATDGTISSWAGLMNTSIALQRQGVAVADGNNVYLLGGQNNGTAFNWVDCTKNPPLLQPGNSLNIPITAGKGVSSRGYVYVLPDDTNIVLSAKLQTDVLMLGPTKAILPVARAAVSMFVY